MSRSKEVHAQRRKEGRPLNQKVPVGHMIVGTGSNRRYVRDMTLLPYFRYMRCLRRKGISFAVISDKLEALIAKKEKREPTPRVHFTRSREWSASRVRACLIEMHELLPDCKPSERAKHWNRML